MAFRSMLVHVDDSDRCAYRLAIASRIAHDFTAQLIGLYLVPTPALTPTVAALLPDSVVDQRLRTTGEAQDLAESRFTEAAQRASVVPTEWRAPAGDPVKAIASHGRGVDLAIIGQTDPNDAAMSFATALADAIILSSGRPVLIVPDRPPAATLGRTVFIGWNDSRQSARAVNDALPFLVKAKRVLVESLRPRNEQGDDDKRAIAHIESFLRRHGVTAAVRHVETAYREIGDAVIAKAQDAGADLIVIGAYGHTPLRERILGGVTRTVLGRTSIPVLMSH